MTELQSINTSTISAELQEKVLLGGDLSKLTPNERLSYIKNVCESLGLNPLTRPFEYITLQGKMTLYARKDATDQLRTVKGISITNVKTEKVADTYVVTVCAQDKTGRTDVDLGVVSVGNLKGDGLANALMKAITKAKRRVTLSICGLGITDESELETIPSVRPVVEKPNVVMLNEKQIDHVPAISGMLDKISFAKDMAELKTSFAAAWQYGVKFRLEEFQQQAKELYEKCKAEYEKEAEIVAQDFFEEGSQDNGENN